MRFQTVQLNEFARFDFFPVQPQTDTEQLPLVIVLPGGGYVYTSPRESDPVALRINTHYMHALVLHYTTGAYQAVTLRHLLEEVREAVQWARDHADALHIDRSRISVMGFSAGGHLAAHCSSRLANLFHKVILAYPATHFPRMSHEQQAEIFHRLFSRLNDPDANEERIRETIESLLSHDPTLEIGEQTRPTFIFQTVEDETVDPHATVLYALSLMEHGVPCELLLYQKGPHGLSLADETCNPLPYRHQARWFEQAMEWLKEQDRAGY